MFFYNCPPFIEEMKSDGFVVLDRRKRKKKFQTKIVGKKSFDQFLCQIRANRDETFHVPLSAGPDVICHTFVPRRFLPPCSEGAQN